jgi:hypothetical protein
VGKNSRFRCPRFQIGFCALLVAIVVIVWCVATGIYGCILAATVVGIGFLLRRRRPKLAIGVGACFISLACGGVGTWVEVRLDTGDQRLLVWGMPFHYESLQPELRQRLLSLNDPQIPKQWVWCATRVGTNNADYMVFRFYCKAVAWLEIDPEIAKLVVRDIAKYVQTTHGRRGAPECWSMLWRPIDCDNDDKCHVKKNWRDDPNVQSYLKSKGYTYPGERPG